jgi:phosphoglycerate dehydrogenase-like enzyme
MVEFTTSYTQFVVVAPSHFTPSIVTLLICSKRVIVTLMSKSTTIWCNAAFSGEAANLLTQNLGNARLIFSADLSESNLKTSGPDPLLAQAEIAFGQPDPQQVIDLPNVKWVHLTSAGYTRYDTAAFKSALKNRGGTFTNSSTVYSDPCAEHAMAMILTLARQLPQAIDQQRNHGHWNTAPLRAQSHLLRGQSILIYGYGSIARRLVEMLKPFHMNITAVRRTARGDEGIPIVTSEQADSLLPTVNHVLNILPASAQTEHFFDARRLSLISPQTYFYNIGRGNTVDQAALTDKLSRQSIAGAYLDVTTPEPLPPDHPLWKLSNCWITPHTAGGHHDELIRQVKHFRQNLDRYLAHQRLTDTVEL